MKKQENKSTELGGGNKLKPGCYNVTNRKGKIEDIVKDMDGNDRIKLYDGAKTFLHVCTTEGCCRVAVMWKDNDRIVADFFTSPEPCCEEHDGISVTAIGSDDFIDAAATARLIQRFVLMKDDKLKKYGTIRCVKYNRDTESWRCEYVNYNHVVKGTKKTN